MTSFDVLSNLACRCVAELLDPVAIAGISEPSGPPPPSRWIMASISFVGESASGAITVVGDRACWMRYASGLGLTDVASEAVLCDAAGELVNMAVGRVRRALLGHGVDVRQATPTCAFGDEITFRNPGRAESRWVKLGSDVGEIYVRLDAMLEERCDLEKPATIPAPTAVASNLVFF